MVRNQIGPVECFKKLLEVNRLLKTRSGKILRKTMRQIINGESFKTSSIIDDPAILEEVTQRFKELTLTIQPEIV